MHTFFKSGALAVAVFALVVLLVIALVAITRCRPADIPAIIRAFGSWVHVSIRI